MKVYKVGVELMLLGNINSAITALSKNLLGIGAQVKQLQAGFTGLKAAIVGALGAYASVKTIEFLGKMAVHGNEIVHQQELMRIAGLSQQEIAEATAKAYETSAKVQTTTIAENLKHLRELRYAFGDLAKAQAALDQVSKVNSVLQTLTGTDSDEVWQLVKAIEMKGPTIDPKLFADYIDKMNQVIVATGGKVTPGQYFSTFKYGRTAMQGWDEDFIMGALPRSIQSMSGGGGSGSGSGGPGNALMSAFGEIVQGKMSRAAADEFAKFGIGTAKNIRGSSFSLTDVASKNLMMHNPYEWVQQVLMPALDPDHNKSQEEIVAHIGKMFPHRTAGQIITEYGLQGRYREGAQSQFEKDIALQKQSMKTHDAFQSLMDHDLAPNMKAFTAQWTSMMEALGAPLVPTAISIMKSFTGAFTWVTQFAQVHPDAIRRIAEALGVFAVAAIGLTIGAAAAAIISIGAIPALIGAAVGALGTIVALNWDFFKGAISGFTDALSGMVNGIVTLWGKLKGAFGGDAGVPNIASPMNYDGDGNGLLHRISYGPSGSAGYGGSSSTGGGASGRRLSGGSSSTGGGAGGSLIPGNLTGNAYIGALRAPFAAELSDPAKRMQFAAMLLSEGSPLATAESAMNRSNFAGKSLMQMLHSGFYGPINRGQLPKFMAELRRNPKLMAKMNAAINAALAGSNIIHGFTDQGMPSDPGGRWEMRHEHMMQGGNVFGDWLNGRGTTQWRRNFESRARGSAVPPPKSGGDDVHIHKHYLDGKQIAAHTMSHIAKAGNTSASGGRMYDRSYTRPISI